MTRVDRDVVLDALTAQDVADHLGIKGRWSGRWMRSSRCGETDHGGDHFGLARDGHWHCHACNKGGDLLALLALGAGLDVRADFQRVLELGAEIAGVTGEKDFGGEVVRPPPRERAPMPALPPLFDRVKLARDRARWVWARMVRTRSAGLYLDTRGIRPAAIEDREDYRSAGVAARMDQVAGNEELARLVRAFAVPGLAIPVRSLADDAPMDIRIRRFEPRTRPDGTREPKIIGMTGGITSVPADQNHPRQLLACYGRPGSLSADQVVVTEGMLDYLSALATWPHADVLGAVDAAQTSLVAAHAARYLAQRDDSSTLILVEQNDAPNKRGERAADRAINEDVHAAGKVAKRILGAQRVARLDCARGGTDVKDLNDLLTRSLDPRRLVSWWQDDDTAAA